MNNLSAKVIGVNRHRLAVDGKGVTTLVGFYGCPLRCRYCLNPRCFSTGKTFPEKAVDELIDELSIDNLYFLATDGGVTFGGGEPLLQSDFICEFRKKCPEQWNICLETCLNVPQKNVEAVAEFISEWIIDIKDLNPDIYERYTGKDNALVLSNLRWIAAHPDIQKRTLIRLPHIPDFNTPEDIDRSESLLREMGFTNFDRFDYQVRNR